MRQINTTKNTSATEKMPIERTLYIGARYWRYSLRNALRLHTQGETRRKAVAGEIGRRLVAAIPNVSEVMPYEGKKWKVALYEAIKKYCKGGAFKQAAALEMQKIMLAVSKGQKAQEIANAINSLSNVYIEPIPLDVQGKDEWADEGARIRMGYEPLLVWAPAKERGASKAFVDVPVFDIAGTTASRKAFHGYPLEIRGKLACKLVNSKKVELIVAPFENTKTDVDIRIVNGKYTIYANAAEVAKGKLAYLAIKGLTMVMIQHQEATRERIPMDEARKKAVACGAGACVAYWLGDTETKLPQKAKELLLEKNETLLNEAHGLARDIIADLDDMIAQMKDAKAVKEKAS